MTVSFSESKSDVITKLMEESQASAEHITRLKTDVWKCILLR